MALKTKPVASQWYRHLDKGQEFQVIAVDEAEGTVEIQHFDGDVEEVDLEDWFRMEVEPIETPEDWTGPMDNIERDDLGYTETAMSAADWEKPLHEEALPEDLPAETEKEEKEED